MSFSPHFSSQCLLVLLLTSHSSARMILTDLSCLTCTRRASSLSAALEMPLACCSPTLRTKDYGRNPQVQQVESGSMTLAELLRIYRSFL